MRDPATLEAIHLRICSNCVDSAHCDGDSIPRCELLANDVCHLSRYLPQLVEVVDSVDSPWMDDYVEALRARICANCIQSTSGSGHPPCPLRTEYSCMLERYLSMVMQALVPEAHSRP